MQAYEIAQKKCMHACMHAAGLLVHAFMRAVNLQINACTHSYTVTIRPQAACTENPKGGSTVESWESGAPTGCEPHSSAYLFSLLLQLFAFSWAGEAFATFCMHGDKDVQHPSHAPLLTLIWLYFCLFVPPFCLPRGYILVQCKAFSVGCEATGAFTQSRCFQLSFVLASLYSKSNPPTQVLTDFNTFLLHMHIR